MQIIALLEKMRSVWINRLINALAKGAGVREDFRDELEKFYQLLMRAVETGNSEWIDPILAEWSMSLTQTDLEEKSMFLPEFIGNFMAASYEAARDTLDENESLTVIGVLIPIYSHIIKKSVDIELNLRLEFLTKQLDETRATLEKLDQRKSDFITVAAHELKTPLTLVDGYAAMIREVVAQDTQGYQAKAYVDGIEFGVNRLRQIIEDIIDVSLIDSNLLELNFQPFWLNRLLRSVGIELENALNERQQILTVAPFPGSDEVNMGDPERLRQVFRNLILNAIKYTPDGGAIYIDGRKLPGFIEVTVRDTGIGIDPEDQAIIFEKFGNLGKAALHSSGRIKFKGGGPGLGLHIAKGIVDAHGGTIWVESNAYDEEKFPGTTFHVLLPTREELPDYVLKSVFAKIQRKE